MKQRIRLCVVNPFQTGGGAEFQIQCLLHELIAAGRHEIFYLAHHVSSESSPGYQVVKIGRGDGVPRFGYITHARPLWRALRALAPDVIYQRVGGGYTGICAWYAVRQRTRMVWHVSSDSDVSPDSRFHGRNPVRRFLEKRSIEYGIRHADCIVAQTGTQSRDLQRHYGRSADVVVPNFHPAPTELPDKTGPLTVVWAANLKPEKQPEIFVRLAQSLQDLPVRFVLVGDTAAAEDPAWKARLLAAIASTPNVERAGRLSQQEVNALLARSHLFVSTSIREGFPNTFIQAWLRAVPVVSLNIDPDGALSRERIGECVRSEGELAAAARRLLTDSTLHADYAARAKDYAAAHHSLRNTEQLIRLLEPRVDSPVGQ